MFAKMREKLHEFLGLSTVADRDALEASRQMTKTISEMVTAINSDLRFKPYKEYYIRLKDGDE